MKPMFKFFLVLALCFGVLGILSGSVNAQGGCQDAAGGPIPCPTETPKDNDASPTDKPKDNDNPRKSTPTSQPTRVPNTATPTPSETPTSTPEPTATPLPEIAISPTEETNSAKAEWSGICKDTTCISQFTNGCKSVGGTVETGEIKEGTVPLTCKVPKGENEPEIGFAAAPTEETNSAKAEWSGICKDTTCIAQFTNGCKSVGGTVDIGEIKEGTVPLTCKVPMGEYEPEIGFAAAPTEETNSAKAEWSGICKNTTCIAQFTNGCESVGGTVEIGNIEKGNVPLTCKVPMGENEPEIVFAAAPSGPQPGPTPSGGFPPGGWLPWTAGFFGLLIGLLLPAVQKLMDKPKEVEKLERAGIFNLTDNEPQAAAADYLLKIEGIEGESAGAQADKKTTIKKKEEGGGTEATFLKLGDIKGETAD